ncbi:MAG: AIR synthase-related protein [Planctomycetota bacterium]
MTTASRSVHRIEVRPTAGDPVAARLIREASALGIDVRDAKSARVYLIETDAPRIDGAELNLEARLLTDPVTEEAHSGAAPVELDDQIIEVHPLPGVMDPAAQTVERVLSDTFGIEATVSTGWRYDLRGIGAADAKTLADRLLANPVVAGVHTEPFHPGELPKGHAYEPTVTHVPIRDLDDPGLEKLSREGHLFLDLHEMHAVQAEYQRLGRDPTDVELETLAQTWSEHCVHKTLKSRITYRPGETEPSEADPIRWEGRPGHTLNADGSITIDNLLKSTVAAATFELIEEGVDWTLSVFVDNAGIIRFDEDTAVCVKVETHNRPSAIEPYGGAATGTGGCIRDIIGTGLAAKPIASTDVFCVAPPDTTDVPAGCVHPKRVLTEVVAGIRDYGNRMGIPTVNGAVYFDERYIGNPLVYCGCVGVLPADLVSGDAQPGDRIIALGGRTGRDGIHGATFSSAGLTDTHADEFAHAVQIGNAIEEKRVLDAILRARDDKRPAIGQRSSVARPLFHAITDCGAGGFSSAIGEMGERLGAEVHLERAPLKYDGLSYTEIWISEAQERMVLAVPQENVPALQKICDEEGVELADLGHFGTDGAELILNYHGTEVGRLPMSFVHDGIPTPTREAAWNPKPAPKIEPGQTPSVREALLKLLAHPNIASKHFIVRQYDHEVQGNTVIRPLGGPMQRGPIDASVVQPVPGSKKGLAIACGLATGIGDPEVGGDPYEMALAAIDECVRNLVCVGADPDRIAILDNFCWPSCKKPQNLASLVRAAEGCYDGAKAYRTPFISGKDSLNNQFTTEDGRTIEIPPTLLISGVGVVDDVSDCVTMDAKRVGSAVYAVESTSASANVDRLGGSLFARHFRAEAGDPAFPRVDLAEGPKHARAIAAAIRNGLVASCHDCSDGGPLVAVSEMLIAGSSGERTLGAEWSCGDAIGRYWSERASCYIVEVPEEHDDAFKALMDRLGAGWTQIARTNDTGRLSVDGDAVPVTDLAAAWLGTLDW